MRYKDCSLHVCVGMVHMYVRMVHMCVRMVHICVRMVHMCVMMVHVCVMILMCVRMVCACVEQYNFLLFSLLVFLTVLSFIEILQNLDVRICLCLLTIGICIMTSRRLGHT